MAKKMKANSEFKLGPSDFFLMGQPTLPETPEAKHFADTMWPLSVRYASPLNPIFLVECASLDLLRQRPFWMIRDGLIPLLWFFEMYPVPKLKNFTSKLFVAEDLAAFIPDPWRMHFGTYQKVTRHSAQGSSMVQKLLVTGVISDLFCSVESLDRDCKRMVAWLQEEKKKGSSPTEHIFCLPTRGEITSAFMSQAIVKLTQAVSGKILCLDWERFSAYDGFKDCAHYDLNDGQVCKDNYLEEHALSAGAHSVQRQNLLAGGKVPAGCRYVELSPFHGLLVKTEIDTKSQLTSELSAGNESSEVYQAYHRALRAKAQSQFPWPNWLRTWQSPKRLSGAVNK